MGILYEPIGFIGWGIAAFVLLALMAFNELGRTTKWGGVVLFIIVPAVLTIFVWPTTAAPGNEYGTGNWFTWVKTYSALAGCIGFMALRFIPGLVEKKMGFMVPTSYPGHQYTGSCHSRLSMLYIWSLGRSLYKSPLGHVRALEYNERHCRHS